MERAGQAEMNEGGFAGFQDANRVDRTKQLFHGLTQLRRNNPGGWRRKMAARR
jgi:hypothetical protein